MNSVDIWKTRILTSDSIKCLTGQLKEKLKKKKSLEDNLPVNPKPPAGADVTHASNCDDSNTINKICLN
jgi:hypothetical protein